MPRGWGRNLKEPAGIKMHLPTSGITCMSWGWGFSKEPTNIPNERRSKVNACQAQRDPVSSILYLSSKNSPVPLPSFSLPIPDNRDIYKKKNPQWLARHRQRSRKKKQPLSHCRRLSLFLTAGQQQFQVQASSEGKKNLAFKGSLKFITAIIVNRLTVVLRFKCVP